MALLKEKLNLMRQQNHNNNLDQKILDLETEISNLGNQSTASVYHLIKHLTTWFKEYCYKKVSRCWMNLEQR